MNAHGNVVALDCEMVGIARERREIDAKNTLDNALCRVSLVSGSPSTGFSVLLDMWVKVESEVLDFRTTITGIDAASYAGKEKVVFSEARRYVKDLIQGRTVVGHATWNDFKVLNLAHPKSQIHDTALDKGLRPPWRRNLLPSLSLLADYWLKEQIHVGIHDSISDAIVALKLYHLVVKKQSIDSLGSDMACKAGGTHELLAQPKNDEETCAVASQTAPAHSSKGAEQDTNLESDGSTRAEVEYSSNSSHSTIITTSEKSCLYGFTIGDKVSAYFYGEWHPGEIRRFEEGKLEILWEDEWSVSLLPPSDVRVRPASDQCIVEVFDNDDDDASVVTLSHSLQKEIVSESSAKLSPSSSQAGIVSNALNRHERRGRWRSRKQSIASSDESATHA